MSTLELETSITEISQELAIDAVIQKSEEWFAAKRNANEMAAVLAERKAAVDAAIEKLQAQFLDANAELILEAAEAEARASEIEAKLRDLAVETYSEHRIKRFTDGISVRLDKKFLYSEPLAIDWARAYCPHAIKESIDKREFETILNEISELPGFVRKEQKPVAVIKQVEFL